MRTVKYKILEFKCFTMRYEISIDKININISFNLVPNFLLLIHSNFVPKAIINKNGIKSGKIN